jgi:hypothetical protein
MAAASSIATHIPSTPLEVPIIITTRTFSSITFDTFCNLINREFSIEDKPIAYKRSLWNDFLARHHYQTAGSILIDDRPIKNTQTDDSVSPSLYRTICSFVGHLEKDMETTQPIVPKNTPTIQPTPTPIAFSIATEFAEMSAPTPSPEPTPEPIPASIVIPKYDDTLIFTGNVTDRISPTRLFAYLIHYKRITDTSVVFRNNFYKAFAKDMKERGIKIMKSNGYMYYCGIRLALPWVESQPKKMSAEDSIVANAKPDAGHSG